MQGKPEAGLGHVQPEGAGPLRQGPRSTFVFNGLKTKMTEQASMYRGVEGH